VPRDPGRPVSTTGPSPTPSAPSEPAPSPTGGESPMGIPGLPGESTPQRRRSRDGGDGPEPDADEPRDRERAPDTPLFTNPIADVGAGLFGGDM